jgi:hypothetical protein
MRYAVFVVMDPLPWVVVPKQESMKRATAG